MKNAPHSYSGSIEAKTGDGRASFRRLSPTDVKIDLEYSMLGREAPVTEDLQQTVQVLCESEIAAMRQALTNVGEALASQLHDIGTRPSIRRKWEDEDERKWTNADGVLAISASRYESEEVLSHSPNVSEAALVRDVINQMIEQRTEGIRQVYRVMVQDVSQKSLRKS